MQTDDKLNQTLTFVSISDLMGQSFYIPGYQRGYRWQPEQVIALLDDIWEFREKTIKAQKPIGSVKYCLQPLVVARRQRSDGEHGFYWEVIDGQQRLTTIFLVLSALGEKPYSIEYETPYADDAYLLDRSRFTPETHLDSYYLNEAYQIIRDWLKNRLGDNRYYIDDFRRALAHPNEFIPQFIWYNSTMEVGQNESLVIDIFDRLNVGKIGLTNAELIKALFMISLSKPGTQEKNRKQLEIGHQWDKIELALNQPLFWNFICQDTDRYVTRIEYLFDILMEKSPDDERNFTFNKYYEKINTDYKDAHELWADVEKLYQLFASWYSDKIFFHLIGYFMASGTATIQDILEWQKDADGQLLTKDKFRHKLKEKALEPITKKEIDLENDDFFEKYAKDKIRSVLLLFNVFSIIKSEDSNLSSMKFPFDLFRQKDSNGRIMWDVEHIHSQTDKDINGADRKVWIETMLNYFTGATTYEEARTFIDQPEKFKEIYPNESSDDEHKFCTRLNQFHDKVADDQLEQFTELVNDLKKYFKENDSEFPPHSLGNLTLLDKRTNRSYQNAFFPVKREIILRKAQSSVFIPLCTQNVFLKAYSRTFGNLTSWTKKDCSDYLHTIIDTLK